MPTCVVDEQIGLVGRVRPRHARVSHLVDSTVLKIRVEVLGHVRVMLHDRQSTDHISAMVEKVDQRPALIVALQPLPQLIPASSPLVGRATVYCRLCETPRPGASKFRRCSVQK